MAVRVVVENGLTRRAMAGVSRREIQRRAVAMMALLQLEKLELSLVLTNDEQMRQLNKIYRGQDRATDVLAFAMREGDFGALAGELLGDVIVSLPTATRQAKERSVDLLGEVTTLVAHGLLHLLGWDHDTAAKDRAMRSETQRLCAAAAVAPRRKLRQGRQRREAAPR